MERKTFIYTIIMGSGGLMFLPSDTLGRTGNKDMFKIHMIYNNTGSCPGLKNAWGLAVWIESADGITLFDTGGDPKILADNLDNLGLDPSLIKRIIISHDHWDHKGGLDMILSRIEGQPDLYVTNNTLEAYTKHCKTANVHGVTEPREIVPGIWTTGSLETDYKLDNLQEHAIVIHDESSMIMLTGCSHPGIVKLAKRAKEIHPGKKLEFVAGGFHLMRVPADDVREISGQLKALDITRIAPSHCTGDKSIDIFREEWGDRFVEMNLGDRQII